MTDDRENEANPQAEHYRQIHDDYARTYYDDQSMQFRNEFVYDKVFDAFDFNGLTVADLASGSGFNSLALLKRFPDARTIGFDISERACADYRELTGQEATCFDLTKDVYEGERVDAAMVFGGLHHCVVNLPATLENVARLVKPGGSFFMFEPNNRYFLEGARKVWYKMDPYFEENTEAALDHADIARIAGSWFKVKSATFRGGPAYFLIFNSMLFRLPAGAKKFCKPALFALERGYNLLPGRIWYPYFIAQWHRLQDD